MILITLFVSYLFLEMFNFKTSEAPETSRRTDSRMFGGDVTDRGKSDSMFMDNSDVNKTGLLTERETKTKRRGEDS